MASTPSEPYGTVVSSSGANVRQFPSTDSSIIGTLPSGTKVGLRCKVHAQDVLGNDIWYLLRDREGWVAARYVDNTGTVKLCKDAATPNGSAEGGSAG
ncbi:SH3 domain-containing protein [Kitasatospora sp. NPDC048239]|uniref:SH3 domain-containing protein n=1 Tax=Kitasatospora sp. NPDC048239 TaxID=3364046 RepID=UPI003718E087